jgi:hypothetical protein
MRKRKVFWIGLIVWSAVLLLIGPKVWSFVQAQRDHIAWEEALEKWTSLQPGMTKAEVVSLMGPPTVVRPRRELERNDEYPAAATVSSLEWSFGERRWLSVELDAHDQVIVIHGLLLAHGRHLDEDSNWFQRLFAR